ncbi:MAG: hemin uptake protein HemP [Burkholderiales bacterium]|nr:hemin uptake protein HemP [Burkholderiales bacterium]
MNRSQLQRSDLVAPTPGVADRQAPRNPDAPALSVLHSEHVLQGQRAVEILHAGVRYRLSVTSMGKLILTK